MRSSSPTLLSRSCILLLFLAFFSATAYKAWNASFTHDESFTYNHYVTAPLPDILTLKLVSANNHLLNTLLMKGLAAVFGPSPFVLRLPNLLAHLGFLVFTFLLLKRSRPWQMVPLFVLVNANPYVLDFFALARGNGLSLFFLAGSLWFFLRFARTRNLSAWRGTLGMATLGVLCHTTLIYFYLSLVLLTLCLHRIGRFFSPPCENLPDHHLRPIIPGILLSGAALVILLGIPVYKLVEAGQLFYGGEHGFWEDTAGTLVTTFFYDAPYAGWGIPVVKAMILLVVAATVLLVIYTVARKNNGLYLRDPDLFLLSLILLLSVGVVVAQFYLLGIRLPVRRYGLLFVPLFMLTLSYLLSFPLKGHRGRAIAGVASWTLGILFAGHTFLSFSASTSLDWTYEKHTARVMEILERDHPRYPSEVPVSMGVSWLFEPTVNFYRQTRNLHWLKPVTRDGPAVPAGYYLVLRDDLLKIPLRSRPPVILFDDGETVLVRV